MHDVIQNIENSVIQHGKFNDRIYIMKMAQDNQTNLLDYLDSLANEKSYSKIFAKVPSYTVDEFIKRGYKKEAYIPAFFKGKEDAFFMAKYLKQFREEEKNKKERDKILKRAVEKKKESFPVFRKEMNISICDKNDAEKMAILYSKVFTTYPFPIKDPLYIKNTMDENVEYYCIKNNNGRIESLASCEMDSLNSNVEMTDFATLPKFRGKKSALHLLKKMEGRMVQKGFVTTYTIARALSYGMNITFANAGYKFAGTLINNTNIAGHFESMNVWYKHIKP